MRGPQRSAAPGHRGCGVRGPVLAALLGLGALLGGAAACGAAADEGGGDTDLPTRGAGPYGKLEPDPETPVEEPVILADPDGIEEWRGPAIRVEGGGRLSVYFAAALGARVELRLASGVTLAEGATDVTTVLTPEQSWEGERVDHPSLVEPGAGHALGLFYEAGDGRIGYAGSDDGVSFERRPAPVLEADGLAEGDRVGEPSAVWYGGDLWLYYAAPAAGAIFVVRFPGGDLGAPERLDGDDRTPERDPVLGPNPFAEQFDVLAVGAPFVRITALADRPVFDLWYRGLGEGGSQTVGFAGSLDGRVWKRFPENPVLPAGGVDESDPCVITDGIHSIMLFAQRSGSGPSVIAAARH